MSFPYNTDDTVYKDQTLQVVCWHCGRTFDTEEKMNKHIKKVWMVNWNE